MEFLLSHWHCVLPLIIIAALAFLPKRREKKEAK
jgi:hypothetical protein